MFGLDEVGHDASVVGVADHEGCRDLVAVIEFDSRCAAVLHEDASHGCQGADLAAAGLDHLDQPGSEHLATAPGVEGSAHVVIDQAGVHEDGALPRCTCVEHRPVVEDRLALLGQLRALEQVGQRAEGPLVEDRAVAAEDHPALCGDTAEYVDGGVDAGALVGELSEEAVPVLVPGCGDTELEVGEPQGVEPVRVQLAEGEAITDPERGEHVVEELTRAQLTDVVDPDVELVPVIAVVPPEDLGVSARHVVSLEHEHLPARCSEACRGGEASGSRTHDHRIPLVRFHSGLPRSHLHTAQPLMACTAYD